MFTSSSLFLGGEVLKLDWGRERGGPFLEEFSLHQSLRFLRRKVVSGGFVGLPAGKDLGVRRDSFLEGGAEFLLRAMPSSFLLSPLSRGGIVFFFLGTSFPNWNRFPFVGSRRARCDKSTVHSVESRPKRCVELHVFSTRWRVRKALAGLLVLSSELGGVLE